MYIFKYVKIWHMYHTSSKRVSQTAIMYPNMKNQNVASTSTTFCLLSPNKHCGISHISQIEKVMMKIKLVPFSLFL